LIIASTRRFSQLTNGVFNLAFQAGFSVVCLWSNNAAHDNQPLPSGYNCISPPIQLFLHFFPVVFISGLWFVISLLLVPNTVWEQVKE